MQTNGKVDVVYAVRELLQKNPNGTQVFIRIARPIVHISCDEQKTVP